MSSACPRSSHSTRSRRQPRAHPPSSHLGLCFSMSCPSDAGALASCTEALFSSHLCFKMLECVGGTQGVWGAVGPASNSPPSLPHCPPAPPCSVQSREQKSRLKPEATQLASPCPGGSQGSEAASAAVTTAGPLTDTAGDGGPVAPDTQGQMAGPPGSPGLRAGGPCSPCSLRLLGAMLLLRKGFAEARLFLLGFLPAGRGRVL